MSSKRKMRSVTPGQANKLHNMPPARACAVCGTSVPSYPGRYPTVCPESDCGGSMMKVGESAATIEYAQRRLFEAKHGRKMDEATVRDASDWWERASYADKAEILGFQDERLAYEWNYFSLPRDTQVNIELELERKRHRRGFREAKLSEAAIELPGSSAQQLLDLVEQSFQRRFRDSFINTWISRSLGPGRVTLHINFALGKDKSEWLNGIFENDPIATKILIFDFDESGEPLKPKISVDATTGGNVTVRSTEPGFAFSRVKVWRKFSGTPDQLAKRFDNYFGKLAKAVKDNAFDMDEQLPFRPIRKVSESRVDEAMPVLKGIPTIRYTSELDRRLVNIESLPAGLGAKYLLVTEGQGDALIAVSWHRSLRQAERAAKTLDLFKPSIVLFGTATDEAVNYYHRRFGQRDPVSSGSSATRASDIIDKRVNEGGRKLTARESIDTILDEVKFSKNVKLKKGRMHTALGLDPDDPISKAGSPSAVAKKLVAAVGRSTAASMINFAANVAGGRNKFMNQVQAAVKALPEAVNPGNKHGHINKPTIESKAGEKFAKNAGLKPGTPEFKSVVAKFDKNKAAMTKKKKTKNKQ